MIITGELKAFLDNIEFDSKVDLLNKLRKLRNDTVKNKKNERKVLKQIIGVAIQQAYFMKEKELLAYKEEKRKIGRK